MAYKTETKEFEKIGRRAANTPAEKYNSVQITEWLVTDPAELVSDALTFLDGNFDYLKSAVLNGINEKRRFLDQPGADPFEQVLRFMQKKGISLDALVEKATK